MAAPRKNTQPVNTNSGDGTPMTDEEKARVAAAEQTPEPAAATDPTIGAEVLSPEVQAQAVEQFNLTEPTTEDVVLVKEAGGHKAGDTITVTHGAAEYLREQGYVDGDDTDED